MSDNTIRAIKREQKPQRVRRDGFAPGIIYGEGLENSMPVKFEMAKLKKILKKKGNNAKIQLKVEDNIRCGIIKEVQTDPITGDIIHIDIQLILESNYVKIQVPIAFTGRSKLGKEKCTLEVCISEVCMSGRADIIPEFITVDVSERLPGDKITVADLKVEEDIKIINSECEVIAIVSKAKTLEIAS